MRKRKKELPIKKLYLLELGIYSEKMVKRDIMENSFEPFQNSYILAYSDNGYNFTDVLTNKFYVSKNYANSGDECVSVVSSFNKLVDDYGLQNHIKNEKISIDEIKQLLDFLNNKNSKSSFEIVDDNNCEISKNKSNSRKKIFEYGSYLTDKEFNEIPVYGREKELENLMITLAQNKKNPLLVGEPGVGKTALVDALAYLIKKDTVPSFLKNKEIIEVDISGLLAKTKYRGDLEARVKSLINYAINNNAILFIDEIHNIIGAGSTMNDNMDISSMLKQAIDRDNLRVIGTTTNCEYHEYIEDNSIKRRFDLIEVKEPKEELLKLIISNKLKDYSDINKMGLNNLNLDIIDYLIELTSEKHRKYDDKVCNPDLVISIIDKAFAIAKYEDKGIITNEHFIKAIDYCNRIYDFEKERVMNKLNNIKLKREKTKIIKFQI